MSDSLPKPNPLVDARAYYRIGPYGETLWYLLTHFRDALSDDLAAAIPRERYPQLLDLLSSRLQLARNELAAGDPTSEYVDKLAHTMAAFQAAAEEPSPARTTVIRELAVERTRQIDRYLNELYSFCKESSVNSREDSRSLAGFLRSAMWPYYFIKTGQLKTEKQHSEGSLLTWMPGFEVLASCPHGNVGGTGGHACGLYPSVDSLIRDVRAESSSETAQLREMLQHSLSLGEMNPNAEVHQKVGHVQKYINDPTGHYSLEKSGPEESRWSDLFYRNRSWIRVNCGPPEEIKGVLYVCAPAPRILLDLGAAAVSESWGRYYETAAPGDGGAGEHEVSIARNSIVEASRRAWERTGAVHVAEALSTAFERTMTDLAEEVLSQEQDRLRTSTFATLGHEIGTRFKNSDVLALLGEAESSDVIDSARVRDVIQRLLPAWGLTQATRLASKNPEEVLATWFHDDKKIEPEEIENSIESIVSYVFHHYGSEAPPLPWRVRRRGRAYEPDPALADRLTLPPCADDPYLHATSALTVGLHELLTNLRAYPGQGHTAPQRRNRRVLQDLPDEDRSVTVSFETYDERTMVKIEQPYVISPGKLSYQSDSLERVRIFETTCLAKIVTTGPAIETREVNTKVRRIATTWTYHWGNLHERLVRRRVS